MSGLTHAWSSIASFVPKLLVFLVILFIGWIIAKAIARFVGMILNRVGFTKLLDRAGAGRMLAGSGVEPISLLTKIIYYFILLIVLQLALSAFGPTNPVSEIVNDIVGWLPQLVVAIVIVVIAGAIANAVKDLLTSTMGGVSYGELVAKIAQVAILFLGVVAALNQIGIAVSVTTSVLTAVLATIAGILIVGVGGGLIGPMRTKWEGWLAGIGGPLGQDGTARAGGAQQPPAGGTYAPPSNG
ncbi:mechanosensitive ion channel family protein [Myceligenerans halotolerans]